MTAITTNEERIYDNGGSETHAPDLYHFDGLAAGVRGFDGVSDFDVQRFHEQGYLVIEDAFSAAEVQGALDGLRYLISGQNPYFNLPLETTVVGAWIALDEATVDNGCMIVLPGSHRAGPVVHVRRRDWQICDSDVRNQGALAVPLKPGGLLLFHSLIRHGTPTNNSEQRRRAIQFHYRPASAPQTSEEERLAVFGEEGKNVTC